MSKAAERAERAFAQLNKIATAHKVQPITVPPWPLLAPHKMEFSHVPERHRKAAHQIATRPTRAARLAVWNETPQLWREHVKNAVGLLLAGTYGTLRSFDEMRARIEDEVPIELAPVVLRRATQVFQAARGRCD